MPVAREKPIADIAGTLQQRQARRLNQPAEAARSVSQAKHVHAADDRPVGPNGVDDGVEIVGREAVGAGVEAGRGCVDELQPPAPVAASQGVHLERADGARRVAA